MKQIIVQETAISFKQIKDSDYISLTDMAKNFDGGSNLINLWLRTKDTISFLGAWEKMYNTSFNSIGFDRIKNEAGGSSYWLSVKKWLDETGAVGIKADAGRYGGTYAHIDIAFEFGSWLSPEFKLYLIKEYERLKVEENKRLSNEWNLTRALTKINYRIHTDAIKANLMSNDLTLQQINYVYANEADMLNVAMFGKTAKQWQSENPNLDGNMRDYATIEQLIILSNMESFNAELIERGKQQKERIVLLNAMAKRQMQSLISSNKVKLLETKK
jgi:hypothetical protein